MKRTTVSRFLAAAPICLIPVLAACHQSSTAVAAQNPQDQSAVAQVSTIPYDHDLTDSARVLAGMLPERPDYLANVTRLPGWQNWHRELDENWARTDADRFTQMRTWAATELPAFGRGCTTLMYPFAGPDLLNAYLLFPNCHTYVLFGLERLGSLPAFDKLTPDRLDRLVADTRRALGDLVTRNYFITSKMMSQFETQELHGNLPIMAIFLARLNARIVSVRQLDIWADGNLHDHVAGKTDVAASALEIVFYVGAGQPQTVVYFRAQAEDAALKRRPGVIPYLEAQAPFITFLKAASYLLHDDQFSMVRRVLLNRSTAVMQDDSGIPFRFLAAPAWRVSFYGRYQKPVKDFNYGYQPDLAKAYAVPDAVKPLTFSFGYHWATGSSTVMLAVRESAGLAAHSR
jgi:hypothetical protein